MLALVDCNNFYCSCERVFNPKLNRRPVIVLSNNDGCAIARSEEAKETGIKMGAPAHLIKDIIERHNVAVFSSNYTLYGDMSERVMNILTDFVPAIEYYSIDEAFLDMSDLKYQDLQKLGETIRQRVKQWTGIPVTVGIAPTKVLAKMANRYAKKKRKDVGVHWLANQELTDEVLAFTEVGDIWGIGGQYSKLLQKHGINTAADLVKAPEEWVRKEMTVVCQRLYHELKGISVIEWELQPPKKKGICCSKSFGTLMTDKQQLEQACANYAAVCSSKLREQQSCAGKVHVFVRTNQFRKQDVQYFASVTVQAEVPTSDNAELIKYALHGLNLIFKQGINYLKVGVEVGDIVPATEVQRSLFDVRDRKRSGVLMAALDKINKVFGRDVVRMSRQGYERRWKLRAEHLSKRYTTRVEELLTLKN